MKSFVLSGHPLSSAYRKALEGAAGCQVEPLHLLALRQSGVWGLLGQLRRVAGDRLYVAYEDASSTAILPVLRLAATLTRVREQFVVNEELGFSRLTWRETMSGLVGLSLATLRSTFHCALSSIRAKRLLNRPRLAIQARGDRVLYLNSNLWFGIKAGGSVGHISGVINGFCALGLKVLFCSAGGRLLVRTEIELFQLKPPASFGVPWAGNLYSFDNSVVGQIEPEIRRFAPAFIYQRMSVGNFSGVRLSRRFKVPLVLEYNGSEVWVARNWGRRLAFERAAILAEDVCLKHAQVVVTVSEALKEELISRNVEASRIVCYPNCIDPEMFDPTRFPASAIQRLRNLYGIEPKSVLVTFLGSFGQWHGVPVLAEAICRFVDMESEWLDQHAVQFLLIGDGPKMSEVLEKLNGKEKSKYVKLAGLVPQVEAPLHLAASDILVSPHIGNADGSTFFGSPTKLFEYMAMARSIVASDLAQIGDVLQNSMRPVDAVRLENHQSSRSPLAVLCAPGDVNELQRGIRMLVENPSLRSALGNNARSEALARYTWRHHVDAILGHCALSGATKRAAQ